MKKLSMFLLVLVTVLAMGSVVFAGPLNGTNPDDVARLNGEINVTGTVGPYAAFRNFTRNNTLPLNFVGRENENIYENLNFHISSNTPIKLLAGFEPLSNENYQIKTRLTISPTTTGAHPLNETLDVGSGWTEFETSELQGVEEIKYVLHVTGTLGDIHDQAAGDYETTVILTIAKAD